KFRSNQTPGASHLSSFALRRTTNPTLHSKSIRIKSSIHTLQWTDRRYSSWFGGSVVSCQGKPSQTTDETRRQTQRECSSRWRISHSIGGRGGWNSGSCL